MRSGQIYGEKFGGWKWTGEWMLTAAGVSIRFSYPAMASVFSIAYLVDGLSGEAHYRPRDDRDSQSLG